MIAHGLFQTEKAYFRTFTGNMEVTCNVCFWIALGLFVRDPYSFVQTGQYIHIFFALSGIRLFRLASLTSGTRVSSLLPNQLFNHAVTVFFFFLNYFIVRESFPPWEAAYPFFLESLAFFFSFGSCLRFWGCWDSKDPSFEGVLWTRPVFLSLTILLFL